MKLRRRTNARKALTLLEVLAALAIFMLSVVVISQMIDSAARAALQSNRLTQAALHCESVIGELVSGLLPMESSPPAPIEGAGEQWTYEIVCEPQEWTSVPIDNQNVQGLCVVHVTVVWQTLQGGDRVEHTLSRVILDPRVRVPAQQTSTTTTSR